MTFANTVPVALAGGARARDQVGEWMSSPWPGTRHRAAATRAILVTNDRFLPPLFIRQHVRDPPGIGPIRVPGGHDAP